MPALALATVMSDRRGGVAYLITNTVNGKRYIGIARNARRRWTSHKTEAMSGGCRAINRAIAAYGPENFIFEVIASARSWTDLLALERILIEQEGTHVSLDKGYNVTLGGEGILGVRHSVATKAEMSAKKIGRHLSETHRAAISRSLKGLPKSDAHIFKLKSRKRPDTVARQIGVPRRAETVAKVSAALKGRRPSDESLRAAHAAWTGSKHTPEARAKISAAGRGRKPSQVQLDAIRLSNMTRQISDATRNKMSAAQKARFAREKAERGVA